MRSMSEATGTRSPLDGDTQASSLEYLSVTDRLRLLPAATEVEQQLEQIADTYDKLVRLCANFKNLKPKISITGPILPD
jgi:hypothetical protein